MTEGSGNGGNSIPPRPVPLTIDGARIHGEWRREPVAGRPVLVYLHDGLGCIQSWRGFPDMLADAMGLGAFAYDRLGYGRSDALDPFPERFVEDAAERLPRILDAAGIGDCVLVGHSDGATVALMHAATGAGRIAAVVSVSAHVMRDPLAYRGTIDFGDSARAGRAPNWLERFHPGRGTQVLLSWADGWRRNFDADWDVSATLSGITAPLLAALGTEDAFTHPLQIEAIARATPHAETHLLDGVDHFPHHQDPAALVALVADFLRRSGV